MRKADPRFAVNARWTAVVPLLEWRHFRVVDRRWRGHELDVELMAVCDRAARTWIDAKCLLDPARFVLGWRDPPVRDRAPSEA